MTRERLDHRGAWLAVVTVLLTALFQAIWYAAPEILEQPLWSGSTLNVGFLLGTWSIFFPVVVAWIIVRPDAKNADRETFETSGH